MKNKTRLFQIPIHLEQRIFLFLSVAISVSIPFQAIYNSIFCIALFVFWTFFMKKKFVWPQIKIIIAISILFWMALLGMLYTQNIEEGWFRLQQKSLLLLLPLVLGTTSLDWKNKLKWIMSFFVIGVVSACFICLVAAFKSAVQYHDFEKFFSHGLAGTTDLYTYLLAIACLASILIIAEANLSKLEIHTLLINRVIAISLISFLSVFILLLSVKQIIITWIIFIIAYSIRMNTNKWFLPITLTAGLLLTVSSVLLIPTLKEKMTEIIEGKDNTIPLDQDASLGKGWNGIAMRKAVWTCALDAIKNDLWIGAGTGDGQDKLQAAYENRQFYFASRYNHFNTHNQYLQTLVNYGIIGLIVWLASLVWLITKYRSNWLVVGLLGCMLFAMLTESMLETNKGILLMSFMLTISLFGKPDVKLVKDHMGYGYAK